MMLGSSRVIRIFFKNEISPSRFLNLPLCKCFRSLSTDPNININSTKQYKTETNYVYLEDPDHFGTLSGQFNLPNRQHEDEGDLKEENHLKYKPLNTQKLTTKQYADLIKENLKHNRVKEALDVLEVKMLVEDRVKPENYIYNILISACADVGYTKKAFKLYNDMKRRDLKVTGDTYTCLFNACANSPWPVDGLKNARHLRQIMVEKGVEPNLTNYNVMIKAFGRCGDLSTAFQLVDEMLSKKIKVRVHTLNFLLQSCITDKINGLRHALIVWRKMLNMREKPNIYSFNLMLKCVKECNFGSEQDVVELLEFIKLSLSKANKNISLPTNTPLLDDFEKNSQKKSDETHVTNTNDGARIQLPQTESAIPNLLSQVPQMSGVVSLQEVKSPQDKFLYFGGETGFLLEMEKYSVKPDIKTFTQMLPLISSSVETENELISTVKAANLKTDINFYNLLMKKRCLRLDYDSALAVKQMIQEESDGRKKKYPLKKKFNIRPNIMTYGILAMACKKKEDAEKLLNEMGEAGLKINIEILGTLLRQGTVRSDFGYILYIMNSARDENIKINEIFMRHLQEFNEKCEKNLQRDAKGRRNCTQIFARTHGIYIQAYERFLQEVNADSAPTSEHPWEQFNRLQPETVQRQNLIKHPKKVIKRNFKFVAPYKP